jgi:hypothetical protein
VPGLIGSDRVFDLERPRTTQMPIHPAHKQAGYSYLLHRHHEDEYRPNETNPRTGAAGIFVCGEHNGTYIDALCQTPSARRPLPPGRRPHALRRRPG